MPEDNKTFATPKVRKFARELGANIKQIGTGVGYQVVGTSTSIA